MSYYIFRNFTSERLFDNLSPTYSDYGDVFNFKDNYDNYIWFYHPPIKTNIQEIVNEINDYSHKLDFIISKISSSKTIILFQLNINLFFNFYISDNRIEESITTFNQKCKELSFLNQNIKIISIGNFIKNYAISEIIDWKYYYISQMYINPKLSKPFQAWFLNSINLNRKKCLVLDLDNTLWGGVLGEDGINGIQIGNSYPGIAFLEFQQNLLNASKHGIILAICSKNNETDVNDVWQNNPNIILTKENFAAWRINWNSKVENIKEIANELNIGLDSIVFIDDNPVEREAVKSFLPDVTVPDFPIQPYLLFDFFRLIYDKYFQIYSLTNEDKSKTKQYLENTQRNIEQNKYETIDQYLESLQIEIDVQGSNENNISRISQLTQKTNQFNLTTQRYTEGDIRRLISEKAKINCANVKDKFGDNGITILSIITFEDHKTAIIDSFLLSCRILGRGIEIEYFKYILNSLINNGFEKIKANYLPTLKNKQVQEFYIQFGFKSTETLNDGQIKYELNNPSLFELKGFYKFQN